MTPDYVPRHRMKPITVTVLRHNGETATITMKPERQRTWLVQSEDCDGRLIKEHDAYFLSRVVIAARIKDADTSEAAQRQWAKDLFTQLNVAGYQKGLLLVKDAPWCHADEVKP